MILAKILREKKKKRELLKRKAVDEIYRLTSLLKEKFHFESCYIHGSLLSDSFKTHSDIDIVVKGLKISDFFKAYAFLIRHSSYTIDLKPFEDLTDDLKRKILEKGVLIG